MADEAKQNDKQVQAEPVDLSETEDQAVERGEVNEEDNLKMIMDIPVDIRVELGHTVLNIGEILRLTKGSVVALDRLTGSPSDIMVNGKLIGRGDVVVVDENFGIRITSLVKPEDRIAAL